MTDTVYGTYISDDLKLVNHRVRHSGVMHRHDIRPLDPNPGDEVDVRVKTPGAARFDHVALYYTTDGSTPAGSRGVATSGTAIAFTREQPEWDALVWDYILHWRAVIPGQPDGTMVQYVISAWVDGGEEVYADTPNVDDTVQHTTMLHYETIPADSPLVLTGHFPYENVFSYHVDTFQTPVWADDAVIYHVFIDRFYPGDGKDWVQTDDLNIACGGTLWGVRDKLDYLAELGVNCIWLSPTWPTPSYHGYDITDYRRVEPRLGGEKALRAVIDGAHRRDIRVLLDMACNHVSNEHPFFLEALNDEGSPYRDWFFFNDRIPVNGYKSFFGVQAMPRINLNHPDARDWMVANAVMWIRDYDIDGYRLDVADGPGPSFWPYFRKACREVKPDCLIFGEIMDTPARLRTYAGRLDGCLDFPLNEALRHTFALEIYDGQQFAAFVANNAAFYPADFVRPTFLDNHDMNRFSYIAENDDEKLKRAAAYQLQLPGPAVIYYGTEVGVRQDFAVHEMGYEDIRRPMLWDDAQDRDLLSFYKEQIQARKRQRANAPKG